MKLGKIMIFALLLSLLLIGTVNATIVTNDSQTQNNINQIDESNANTDILLKTENINLNSQINENEIKETNTILAADNSNETNTVSETNNQITVNDYSQLYNQIENLKENGTSKSYIINLNPKGNFAITDTIKLQWDNSPAKEFTINGNGATIDGKNSKPFLTIFENYKVTLNNLNFVDNLISKDGGGAIAVHTGGELNINNCNFTGCKALNETESIHAGALRVGFDAIVRITNSIFNKNSASYGAGAIVIGGTLTEYNTVPHPDLDPTTIAPTAFIDNCQFIDNTAGHGGAINIEDYCSAIITDCTFKGNSAVSSEYGLGGGICSDISTYLILINNTFQDNTAKQLGGAICTDESSCLLSINNTFKNNIAENSGGALYNALYSQIKIENNIFIKNEATFGGAVCNHDGSTLTVTDSTFNENKATNLGGAISAGKNNILNATNTAFNKNKADLGGAIYLSTNSNLNASAITFTQNNATTNGGAIYSENSNNLQIKDGEIIGNTATTSGGGIITGENTIITVVNTAFNKNKAKLGGAILSGTNSETTLDDTTFTQNTATSGGAIYTAKNNNIQIKNTEITDNTATTNGGAILAEENNILTLANTTFNKNEAKLGGAICLSVNSNLNTYTTSFTQNSATANGGAIYSENNNNLEIKNTEIIDNTATTSGGAIITGENNLLTVANTTFNKNKAKLGGAILSGVNSETTLEDTTFTQNSATSGGAIYTAKNNNIQIKNTEITDNTATTNGGAILAEENNTLTAIKTTFNANKANVGGAIFSGINSDIILDDTTLTQNTADTNGGAIITGENNTLTTTKTEFNKNKANLGGAILSGINSKMTTSSTTFTQNTADANGGAVFTGKNTVITTIDTIFGENKANLGGAICLSANSEITTDKTIFAQNNATTNGGAIYNTNDNNVLLRNTEITNNLATKSGGAIYTGKTSTVTASNTTFNKNTAGNIGGGICGDTGSTITLSNSKFNDNSANIANAIYNPQQGTLILKGTTSIDPADYTNNGELKTENTINTEISLDSIEYYSELVVEGKLVDEYDSPLVDETVNVCVENENVRANTDNNGNFIARLTKINPGTYLITATYYENSIYNQAKTEITKKIVKKEPTSITAPDITTTYNTEKDLVITLVNNQNSPLSNTEITVDLGTGAKTYTTDNNGQIKISTKDLSAKTYVADIRFNGNENYIQSNTTAIITVNKQTTSITAPDITTTCNINKEMVITLKNGQNSPLTNTHITVDLGTGAKTYTTDNNGQIKISTKDLAPNTYEVKIRYNGNENYKQSDTTSKLTINKQTTKITSTDVTTIYNGNKNLAITLTSNQIPLRDMLITVAIGTSIKQYRTDNNGQLEISTNNLNPDIYDVKIRFNGDENYEQSNTTSKITINKDTPKITTTYSNNEFIITFTNSKNSPIAEYPITVNFGTGSKAHTTNSNGQIKISTKDLAPNTYEVKIRYNGNEKYLPLNTTAKITIPETTTKETTNIMATDITTTYKTNKYLIITLTDSKNSPLANTQISVDLGKGAEPQITDSNGQVKISTSSLAPSTYTAKIKYNGDEKYTESSTEVKVTVNKATPKLTASKKTFKKSVKTKKYTVTLKTNKNKVIKNAWITLKVNKKTYKVKTNSKGQSTFKITNLKKKGTFTAIVKYSGNKYYKAKTVKPKIIVK